MQLISYAIIICTHNKYVIASNKILQYCDNFPFLNSEKSGMADMRSFHNMSKKRRVAFLAKKCPIIKFWPFFCTMIDQWKNLMLSQICNFSYLPIHNIVSVLCIYVKCSKYINVIHIWTLFSYTCGKTFAK